MRPKQQNQKHHTSSSTITTTTTTTLPDWIKETINGGSLKHVDLNTGTNGWASPPGQLFNLRGPNYFSNKQKSPTGPYLLHPAGMDWLKSPTSKLEHVLSRPDNRIITSLKKFQPQAQNQPKPFLLAVNLQVPGRDHYSAVFYFSTLDGPLSPGTLLYKFVNGDDQYRNNRFKIVNKIIKGPWIVRAAVGNYSACLLGRALNCRYYKGESYLEIDVDIASSALASAILHLAMGCVSSVTIDMGFLVEAQNEEELPERLFGAVRVCQMEMSSATVVGDVGRKVVVGNFHGHFHHNRVQAEENDDDDDKDD